MRGNRLGIPSDKLDDNPEFDEHESDEAEDEDIDLDMLPTLLAYCDGELVHTWVRVDWEVKEFDDIENLFSKCASCLFSSPWLLTTMP